MMAALLAGSGPMWCWRLLRRWCLRGAVRVCFFAAGVLLGGARMLYRLGLVGPVHAGHILRWSSWIAALGMRFWRQRRPRFQS